MSATKEPGEVGAKLRANERTNGTDEPSGGHRTRTEAAAPQPEMIPQKDKKRATGGGGGAAAAAVTI